MENLLGRKIRGFEFEGNFHIEMKNYIGKIGTIVSINYNGNPVVEFKDNQHCCFAYQRKEGITATWTFCQTENPLL